MDLVRRLFYLTSLGVDVFLGEGIWRAYNGKRISIMCNSASITSNYTYTLDEISSRGLRIQGILVPEHGYWGFLQAGEEVQHYYDRYLGSWVYSLYKASREEVRRILEESDVLLIDIQDLGLRFYTYLSAVLDLLSLASRLGEKEVLILDRPNPLGGVLVEGPIARENMISILSPYKIPIRYGATIGEIARLYENEESLGIDLRVIPMKGWSRKQDILDIAMPWAPTSPAIPTPDTVYPYALTVYLEATNISEGRGTYTPFKVIGAPFIDPIKLSQALGDAISRDTAVFRPTMFRPLFSKYSGEMCGGVYIHIIDRKRVRVFETSLKILSTLYTLYGDHIELIKRGDRFLIDILYGDPRVRSVITGQLDLYSYISSIDEEILGYRERLEPVKIYS
ncbi:MAG: DUF1343 domain-containing protein [Sulfolobales archaeon]